jgi:hypothetical protein
MHDLSIPKQVDHESRLCLLQHALVDSQHRPGVFLARLLTEENQAVTISHPHIVVMLKALIWFQWLSTPNVELGIRPRLLEGGPTIIGRN